MGKCLKSLAAGLKGRIMNKTVLRRINMGKNVTDRFLEYVKINTQANENAKEMPSNKNIFELLKIISSDLNNLGIENEIDEFGYLYAKLPGNVKDVPPIGFIAHTDTAPDAPGENVKPRIIEYGGGDIILNGKSGIYLRVSEFPEIEKYKGQKIVVTDGTTLLGGDDKAGVAEIMTAIEYLTNHPEIKHGDIHIAFTPDEEIGRGMDKFDTKKFGAEYAYTVDGGEIGGFEFENFNAASAKFTVKGFNIHPGDAKGKMKNAVKIANELISMFPHCEVPECTEGYEGFYHVYEFSGDVGSAVVRMLIRDHSKEKFEKRKLNAVKISEFLNEKYGEGTVELDIKDSYYNMKEIIDAYPEVIEIGMKAYRDAGIEPKVSPIRGGTDGARLSFMGIPTPNIFTGTLNEHSVYECVPIPSMEKAVEVIVNIAKEFVNFGNYIENGEV